MSHTKSGSSDQFFSELSPFTEFDQVADLAVYREAADDWWMVLTDIQGSTQAIEAGRYKEVNLAGASSIAAVTNCCPMRVPFVFGGDGATFLIPPSMIDVVKAELARTQAFVQSNFQMNLRAGFVPVAELRKQNASVLIAKFQLSPGNELAMFRGGGVALAEKMVKKGPLTGQAFVLPEADPKSSQPNIGGLSCRWNLVRAREGRVLSILVVARENAASEKVYVDVLRELRRILGNDRLAGNPVKESLPKLALGGAGFWFEARNLLGMKWAAPLAAVPVWAFRFLLKGVFAVGRLPVGSFQPKQYVRETAINADYRKFDDVLRFVIDCTDAQASEIQGYLESLYRSKNIFYGVHPSDSALMTCFVKSITQNQHIHFIDGGDGGYTRAAVQLKAQMKASASS